MKALNSDRFNVISLKNSFIYRGHYCLEFEKLDMTLRDFLKKKQAVSLQLEEIRPILHQVYSFKHWSHITELHGLTHRG